MSAALAEADELTVRLPKRGGRTMAPDTELGRLTMKAWATYLELVGEQSHRTALTLTLRETDCRSAHQYQLRRTVSFALTAGTKPDELHENLRTELYGMFSPIHPGEHRLGSHRWNESKHEDALALYRELCSLDHL